MGSPVSRLLVANRGEIARRIFRTARAMGIETIAVVSDADRGAPFAAEADRVVLIGGESPADSYLRGDAIVSAARRVDADSVHPGYGFLAENAAFARMVEDAGLIWIGPPPNAIESMGSKLESKRLIAEAAVPTLPSIDCTGLSTDELAVAAEEIGFPLLVKASAGGGGKGMRIVADPAGLADAVAAAGREAQSAFGDATVFLERYLERSRHIEIQVFADDHGNAVSLFERECSIQRRHQKIIEESPSPVIDETLRKAMGEAAVAAARAVDYRGAGTVEFLFQDGEFYFLEMNTRLQVEHPVTEAITGLDLVRLQITVARGEPLPPEALEPMSIGHAIEARLYAEDAADGYLPVTGRLDRFRFEEAAGLRVDSGVEDGAVISIHYDPMLAKVIAWADSRREAADLLARSLTSAQIHGSTTNRDLLVRILGHPEFLAGQADTSFLERHDPVHLAAPLPEPEQHQMAALAAAVWSRGQAAADRRVLTSIPAGFRNNRSQLDTTTFDGPDGEITVGIARDRAGHWTSNLVEEFDVVAVDSDEVTFVHDRLMDRYRVHQVGPVYHVDGPHGYTRLVERDRFPQALPDEAAGSLHAPMPGKVITVAVVAGQEVAEGDLLVVMEAMKMEHSLKSPIAGTVSTVRVSVGDQVEADEILVVVEE